MARWREYGAVQRVALLCVSLGLAAAAAACGGAERHEGAGTSRGPVLDLARAIAVIEREGYERVEQAHSQQAHTLSFPVRPQYGRVVDVFERNGLTVFVLRGDAHTERPPEVGIYWFRSGDVILVALPPPPFNGGRNQFNALTRALEYG